MEITYDAASNVTTLTAGYVTAGDTVVMPCGGQLRVIRWEIGPGPGELSLFSKYGERYIVGRHSVLGIVGDQTGRRYW
jgi:hypothetical protein